MPPERKYLDQEKFSEPEKLDPAFNASITKAEKSGIPTVMAQAKNNYGRWLMSKEQKRYREAVPLFQEVAKIQASQDNRIEAADAYQMVSSCALIIGDVDSLKEGEEAVKKAIELYPDSGDFTELKGTARIKHLAILASLFRQTGNMDYFNQGVELGKKYVESLNSKGIQRELQSIGFTKAAKSPDIETGR